MMMMMMTVIPQDVGVLAVQCASLITVEEAERDRAWE